MNKILIATFNAKLGVLSSLRKMTLTALASMLWAMIALGADEVWADSSNIPAILDLRSIGDPPSAEDLGSIRFLMSDDFPPFNYRADDGRLTGFHIEFARELCAVLEISCTILVKPFEELIAAHSDEKGDAILAALSVKAIRQANLSHTQPYLTLPGRFIAQKNDISALMTEGLQTARIAVARGTAHEAFLKDHFNSAQITTYESAFAARRAVRDREVQYLFGDGMSLSLWLTGEQSEDCCQFVGGPYQEAKYFGHGMTVAFSPDRPALKQGFDFAIKELYRSRKFDDLYLRYFPVGFF